MQIANFEYKCRKCGAVYAHNNIEHVDVKPEASTMLLRAVRDLTGYTRVSNIVLHSCSAFSCGVADLIGYRITDS